MWVWPSMKPGAATSPSPSTSRRAAPALPPTCRSVPPSTATSPV